MPECGSRCLLSLHWPLRGLSGQADDEGSPSRLKALLVLHYVHTDCSSWGQVPVIRHAIKKHATTHAICFQHKRPFWASKISDQRRSQRTLRRRSSKLSTNHLSDNGCNSWGKLAKKKQNKTVKPAAANGRCKKFTTRTKISYLI